MTVLVVLDLALLGVLLLVIVMQNRERAAWAAERRALTDRAIARHTGEIVALDREARAKPKTDTPPDERRYVEGLT